MLGVGCRRRHPCACFSSGFAPAIAAHFIAHKVVQFNIGRQRDLIRRLADLDPKGAGASKRGGDRRSRKLESARAIFRYRESERRRGRVGAALVRTLRLQAFPHGARRFRSFRFGIDRVDRLRSKLVVSPGSPVDFGVTTGCGAFHHAMTMLAKPPTDLNCGWTLRTDVTYSTKHILTLRLTLAIQIIVGFLTRRSLILLPCAGTRFAQYVSCDGRQYGGDFLAFKNIKNPHPLT